MFPGTNQKGEESMASIKPIEPKIFRLQICIWQYDKTDISDTYSGVLSWQISVESSGSCTSPADWYWCHWVSWTRYAHCIHRSLSHRLNDGPKADKSAASEAIEGYNREGALWAKTPTWSKDIKVKMLKVLCRHTGCTGKPNTELQSVTSHMGSQSLSCHATQVNGEHTLP